MKLGNSFNLILIVNKTYIPITHIHSKFGNSLRNTPIRQNPSENQK